MLKSCLLLPVAFPGLIDTLPTVASLKVPAMIVYDVATKVIGTEEFLQYNIAELNSGITFIVLFSQEKPLRWKETNTHNTHTHTHTHTRGAFVVIYFICSDLLNCLRIVDTKIITTEIT